MKELCLGRKTEATFLGGRGGGLAWRLKVLCYAGIDLRDTGWCLGEPRARELQIVGQQLQFSRAGLLGSRSRLTALRHQRHLMRGNDESCAAVGVPRRTVKHVLRVWDSSGAAQLLLEAFDAAVAEAGADTARGIWSRQRARDAVEFAVSSRISPRYVPWVKHENNGGPGA